MIFGPYLAIAKIAAIGVVLVGVGFASYQQGKKAVQADWDASRLVQAEQTAKLVLEHSQEMDAMRKRQGETNKAVSENYERALDEVRSKHAADLDRVRKSGGLRLPGSVCASTTAGKAETKSNGGHHEDAPRTVLLPEQTTASLFKLAEEADQVSEQLRACQAWIRDQGFY